MLGRNTAGGNATSDFSQSSTANNVIIIDGATRNGLNDFLLHPSSNKGIEGNTTNNNLGSGFPANLFVQRQLTEEHG